MTAVKGNHQTPLSVGDLSQAVKVLALMTGQEREVKVLVEIADMRL